MIINFNQIARVVYHPGNILRKLRPSTQCCTLDNAPGGVHRGGAVRKRELRLSPSPMAHSLGTFLAKQESTATGRYC